MDRTLYDNYLRLKETGRKNEARQILAQFIASFTFFDEKREWAWLFLESGYYGHTIRHEIYEHLIFPVLLAGYQENEGRAVFWLARTAQNLYRAKALHAMVDYASERSLLEKAYQLKPNEAVRRELLQADVRWFDYCQHEWPTGILYGIDGANADECEQILRQVAFAQTLDTENQHTEFLDAFAEKVRAYQKRLAARKEPK